MTLHSLKANMEPWQYPARRGDCSQKKGGNTFGTLYNWNWMANMEPWQYPARKGDCSLKKGEITLVTLYNWMANMEPRQYPARGGIQCITREKTKKNWVYMSQTHMNCVAVMARRSFISAISPVLFLGVLSFFFDLLPDHG